MIDSVAGIISAAPIPWTARLATRKVALGASPAVADESGEEHHPEHEGEAPSEDVAQPPARHEQYGERERVGVDGPLETRQRRAEVALDRGSATLTTVLSSMIMKSAKHIAPSVHHLRLRSVMARSLVIGRSRGRGG